MRSPGNLKELKGRGMDISSSSSSRAGEGHLIQLREGRGKWMLLPPSPEDLRGRGNEHLIQLILKGLGNETSSSSSISFKAGGMASSFLVLTGV